MRKKFLERITIILTFTFLTSFTGKMQGCAIMHSGTFTYGNSTLDVKVVIKGSRHIEYHEGGKFIIESKLNWVTDCEYNMTMLKITIPNFPYKIGDIMNVKINRTDKKEIFFTSTVKGKSWEGIFIKIKK